MMTTPIKPGTRYEMPAPAKDGAELKQLDDLINFLGDVKDTARLRAKEESGVKFLHTRTGTPLGRFWKWMMVGWREAMDQRRLFRESIKDVLENIQSSDASDISLIRHKIENQTLRVRMFKEFDIHQLRNDLKVLRALVKSRENESANPAASSSSSTDKKPPVMIVMAKQKPSVSEEESSDEGAPIPRPLQNPLFTLPLDLKKETSPVEAEQEAIPVPLDQVADLEPEPSVSLASLETAVILNEHADEKAESPNESGVTVPKPVVPSDATRLTSKKLPAPQLNSQPQPRRLKPNSFPKIGSTSVLEQNSSSEKSDTSVTSVAAAPEKKITEGKLEIFTKANSGSRFAMIGLLEADAYVFPSGGNAKDPNEKLRVESIATTASGVKAFRGTLADDVSTRSWGMLVMDSPIDTLSAEQKANALYAQYVRTLEEAVGMRIAENKSIQTIAIRPWKDRLLSDLNAQTLIRSVNRFREQHPETNILIVPSAVGEDRKLQTAIEKIGKDSAAPFASASS